MKPASVVIVGMGHIGGSLGMALLTRRLARRVVGIDSDPAVLRRALRRRACTETAQNLWPVAGADLVVLATPVRTIQSLAWKIAELQLPGTRITDVGSAKAGIMRAFRGVRGFVGGHPMCGTERGGIEAADPALFKGATWALVPGDRAALPAMKKLVVQLGAVPLVVTAQAHDRAVALISHLPYALALALVRLGRKGGPLAARLAAGSFRSATRVAAQPAAMSLDLLLANRFHVAAALERMGDDLRGLAMALRKGDEAALKRFQKEGLR
ncbi:MAG: prephenate dehydrogenase/arogenate dehydrogenase family protein [Planctomycetota bacterium]